MRVIKRLEDFSATHSPLIFTMGNFDGVHRGHQMVLRHCRELALPKGELVVLTFSNHPSEILRPQAVSPFICSIPHRLALLDQLGVETVVLLPFTASVATHSATSFLEKVRQFIPFQQLVLGHDAVMGKDREGNRALISALADQWGFKVDYLSEYRYEGTPVSSTMIRHFLQEGQLEKVEDLLGRPYSFFISPSLIDKPDKDSFSFSVEGLCLPPDGLYEGCLVLQDQRIKAHALIKASAPTCTIFAPPPTCPNSFEFLFATS